MHLKFRLFSPICLWRLRRLYVWFSLDFYYQRREPRRKFSFPLSQKEEHNIILNNGWPNQPTRRDKMAGVNTGDLLEETALLGIASVASCEEIGQKLDQWERCFTLNFSILFDQSVQEALQSQVADWLRLNNAKVVSFLWRLVDVCVSEIQTTKRCEITDEHGKRWSYT